MHARATLTVPAPDKMPRSRFVTEAQLAALLQVTRRTLRAWRQRGEMPPVATGPEAEEFAASQRTRGKLPTVYDVAAVSAWLFGDGRPGGRPQPLPASAFDPANDRTMQLRAAGQAARAAGDAAAEKRVRRKLADHAKFVARLGFKSPTAYEDWIARGSPEDELPPECRLDPEVPLADDESCERLQLRSDAAVAKMRGVSPSVVTAERHRAEPPRQPQAAIAAPEIAPEPGLPALPPPRAPSPWDALIPPADDDYIDPFATAGRAAPRRQGSGYWGH